MSDWGIKVCNAGTSVTSTDIRDQIMNSQYSMFKYHSDGTVGFSMGTATTAYGTVNHNLGYVPAYMAYVKYPDDTYQRIVPSIPYGVGFDHYPSVYADGTKVVVGFTRAPYDGTIEVSTDNGNIHEEFWAETVGLIAGNAGAGGKSSAIRFENVGVVNSQSLVSAQFQFIGVFSGTTEANTKYKVYGIDEDDVGDGFDWNSTKTTAVDAREQSKVSDIWNFGIEVLDQVNEIIARPGWTSGNNMGFILNDDGSDSNAYIGDTTSTTGLLTLVKSGALPDISVTFRVIIFKDKIV